MNNVNSNHGHLIIIHLCCLCDFSLLRYDDIFISLICSHFVDRIMVHTLFGFMLGYFINMTMVTLLLIREHLFVKGVLSFDILNVDFT